MIFISTGRREVAQECTFKRTSGRSRLQSTRSTSETFAGVLMCLRGTVPGISTIFGPVPQPPAMQQIDAHFMKVKMQAGP